MLMINLNDKDGNKSLRYLSILFTPIYLTLFIIFFNYPKVLLTISEDHLIIYDYNQRISIPFNLIKDVHERQSHIRFFSIIYGILTIETDEDDYKVIGVADIDAIKSKIFKLINKKS
jgi:hypothetical protein